MQPCVFQRAVRRRSILLCWFTAGSQLALLACDVPRRGFQFLCQGLGSSRSSLRLSTTSLNSPPGVLHKCETNTGTKINNGHAAAWLGMCCKLGLRWNTALAWHSGLPLWPRLTTHGLQTGTSTLLDALSTQVMPELYVSVQTRLTSSWHDISEFEKAPSCERGGCALGHLSTC